jgi:hypothetical protein
VHREWSKTGSRTRSPSWLPSSVFLPLASTTMRADIESVFAPPFPPNE